MTDVSESRLIHIFSLLDLKRRGTLDNKSSISFAFRAAGLVFRESEISALESLTLAEFRQFVSLKAASPEFNQPAPLKKCFQCLDRASLGKVRKDELVAALTSAGEPMTKEDVEFALTDLGYDHDEFIDVETFLRSLTLQSAVVPN
jgi:Ca2+-binding EF-hand superfamily protein